MMILPASPHFTALDLAKVFNADCASLPETLRVREQAAWIYGAQTLLGMPFLLGQPQAPNVVCLVQAEVAVPLRDVPANCMVFSHAVEDRSSPETPSGTNDDNPVGEHVSDYVLEFADGSTAEVPIRRRFAVPQRRIRWGASPFEAVPARGNVEVPDSSSSTTTRGWTRRSWA